MNTSHPTHFENEEASLESTYFQSLRATVSDLASAISSVSSGGVVAVGSGGSLTAAQMLTTLHELHYGHISRAVTPLELACTPSIAKNAAVFLFTAEGKNPDIIAAYKSAIVAGSRSVDIITHRCKTRLNRLASRSGSGRIHCFSTASATDGYLALNSLYSTVVLLLRAYGHELGGTRLDSTFLETGHQPASRAPCAEISDDLEQTAGDVQSLLALYDPSLKVAAIDLESKIREVGLCDIQIADFREFAHGRHFGLTGTNNQRLIVAFPTGSTATIWDTLRRNIPDSIASITCKPSRAGWADTILDSFCSVFRLVAWLGQSKGLDPGRPPVPEFGRRIYYSPLRLDPPADWAHPASNGPRRQPHCSPPRHDTSAHYAAQIDQAQFSALLFDYDGTVVDTALRTHPPPREITKKLNQLLGRGVPVWFVSGRGQSIYHALRANLSNRGWKNVVLGLYNGTIVQSLVEPLVDRNTSIAPTHELYDASALIKQWAERSNSKTSIEVRPTQISITPTAGQNIAELWQEVAGILQTIHFPIDRIFSTDHSIDILPCPSPKRAFLTQMAESLDLPESRILTFADQGRWPGNDHALLNRFGGISVNHEPVHSDLGLKLCPARLRGPNATAWYLARLEIADAKSPQLRARFARPSTTAPSPSTNENS